MATFGSRRGITMASSLFKTLTLRGTSSNIASTSRYLSLVRTEILGSHTAKWMQDTSEKSPMELINEVPPIETVILPLATQLSSYVLTLKHQLYANIVACAMCRSMIIIT
ncbi:hypothetical protein RJ641_033576, partial [Dillenia turbinata]